MSRDRHTFVDLDELLQGDATPASPLDGARFRMDEELARGGLGRVHRGYDRVLEREVAVKALLRDVPSTRARFERETRLTARLQHPNIVPVYDGGNDEDGHPFLAMRLVHGRSLDGALAEAGSLEGRLGLLPHVIDACNAIAYAHSERIAHRDLKPDNILVGSFGETVVIDWGLAKDLDALDEPTFTAELPSVPEPAPAPGTSRSSTLTQLGSVMGTPSYMPPEQARGEVIDERADVYALGAILYELLAGRRPYAGAPDVLEAVLAGPPTPPDALAP
ncbi:MAG: serine/threonine protein kinase, partial [Myxococcales bacterium]|nr:serine/threonine protein kinase [Myxococcales bacterium]